jgi:hypothetical protein
MHDPIKLKAIFTDDFINGNLQPEPIASDPEYERYYLAHKFDKSKLPPEDSHLFFYNGIPIGSRGNILSITGKAKSRKTVVASAIATSAFTGNSFLGFTADIPEGAKILHIDSEQGYFHYYGSVVRIFRDAQLQDIPENFTSILTRDATNDFRVGLVEYLLPKLKPTVMILDGITDFVRNINDQDEATDMSERLMRWSLQYDALIIVVIHTTKTTGYMTGALGTTLEKKSQTVIKVERDDENDGGDPNTSHVICQYARDAGFKTFSIRYAEELGRYDLQNDTQVLKKGSKGDRRPEAYPDDAHRLIIAHVFGYSDLVDDDDIIPKLQKAIKHVTTDQLSRMDAKYFVKYYNDMAYIFMNPEGAWMRAGVATTSNHTTPALETGNLFDKVPKLSPAAPDPTDDLPF